jgi:hypothetical protein
MGAAVGLDDHALPRPVGVDRAALDGGVGSGARQVVSRAELEQDVFERAPRRLGRVGEALKGSI